MIELNKVEEMETVYEIKYIPGNIESMKEALKYYGELLDSGEAFEDSYCIAHFIPEEKGIISEDDLKDYLTGEALFFKYAVNLSELKEDLKLACESIVRYSRELNDSADMWITCEEPFGLKPLYYFASKYPEYGYLLASFMVPYWDDEHMPDSLYTLSEWSDRFGVTEDTLRAYCYCDNSRAREIMLGYDTFNCTESPEKKFVPIQYFRENPAGYEKFKDILVERFKNMPYLQTYTDDERYYDENPLKNFILDMLYQEYPYDEYDDDFDRGLWVTNKFIDRSAEEEIIHLKDYVEKKLKRGIVLDKTQYFNNLREEKEKEKERIRLAKKSESEKWEELFLSIFPKGEDVWTYVTDGKNHEILNEIPVMDIVAEGLKTKCEMAKELKDACYGSLIEGLDDFIEAFTKERISQYSMRKYTEDNEVLRLFDVLHITLERAAIPEDLAEILEKAGKYIDITKRYPVSRKESIRHNLKALRNVRRYGSGAVDKNLSSIYELIQGDRAEAHKIIIEELDSEDEGYYRSSLKGVCTLLGTYILLQDEENNIDDEISASLRDYVNSNLPELLYDLLRSKAVWPTRELEEDIKREDRYYVADYMRNVKETSKLWLPMEEYLVSGRFKGYSYKDSFSAALRYLKDNLKVDSEDRINTGQESYECFTFEEDFLFEVGAAYLTTKIYSLENKDLIGRFFRLIINTAPLRIISVLKALVPELADPLKVDAFIGALDDLKNLGLSNEAYWIVQLKRLHEEIRPEGIDLEALVFSKSHSHYVRLLNLYLNNIEFNRHLKDSWLIFFKDIVEIKESLEKGVSIIEEKYEAEFLKAADTIFGVTPRSQKKLGEIAAKAFKKYLNGKIKRPVFYYEDYLDLNNISYKKERILYFQSTLEELEALGAGNISEDDYLHIKNTLEKSESSWLQEIVVMEGEVRKPLYNTEILNFIGEAKRRGEECHVGTIDIVIVAEGCGGIHEEAIAKYDNQNFDDMVMEDIDLYLNHRKDFNSIKNLISTCFSHYESFGRERYDSVDISDILSDLDNILQQQILSIVSCISPEELEKHIRNDRDKYLSMLIERKINPEEVFNYLAKNNNRAFLKKLLSSIDCSAFIERAHVDMIVVALANIGGLHTYYPLVYRLKDHQSLKVRNISLKLIEVCNITEKVLNPYKITDYGIYIMEKETIVSEKEGVTREAFEPKCIEETHTIKAHKGMYIGFRFTAVNPAFVPKVFNHKVVVKHPYIAPGHKEENIEKKTVEHKTTWNQNGYSDSNIFLGWFFETSDELISGAYTFEIYDMSDKLVLFKTLYVEV